MHSRFFKTSDPVEEAVMMSNIDELVKKDEEYTKKANKEGKAYYKWDTSYMTVLIYNSGIEENNMPGRMWAFVSHWLALTLKFVEDDKIQYYMEEFLQGRFHYKNEYYGQTIYRHMYDGPGPYIYVLYERYLNNKREDVPDYIRALISYYIDHGGTIRDKIPNEDGTKLIEVGHEEAKKYNGLWISPEEHEELKRQRKKLYEEYLKQKKSKKEG